LTEDGKIYVGYDEHGYLAIWLYLVNKIIIGAYYKVDFNIGHTHA
jgi:hypothetical protein